MSTRWLLRRFLFIIYTLAIVSFVIFAITQILPGDAAVSLLGEYATPEQLAAVRNQLGLDQPAIVQYWHWFAGVLHGDFGVSMRTGQPVGPTLLVALSRSLLIAAFALVLMTVVAIPLGVIGALYRGGPVDVIVGVTSYLGISVPEFVTATLLLIIVADYFQLLPATGYIPLTENFWAGLSHLVLPVVTVSILLVAHIARIVRSEMIDVLYSDYVRAAHLKGLSSSRIILRHALQNALLPAITVIALNVGYLLGGIIVIEEIFAIPGLGRYLITAIKLRDLPTIQAAALLMAIVYAVANLLADIAYATIDKRIRYD